MRFNLGTIVATRNALDTGVNLLLMLARHINGDWGELGIEDKAANDTALITGERLLSRYTVGEHSFYVLTERDRSYTTIMLTSDY